MCRIRRAHPAESPSNFPPASTNTAFCENHTLALGVGTTVCPRKTSPARRSGSKPDWTIVEVFVLPSGPSNRTTGRVATVCPVGLSRSFEVANALSKSSSTGERLLDWEADFAKTETTIAAATRPSTQRRARMSHSSPALPPRAEPRNHAMIQKTTSTTPALSQSFAMPLTFAS